MQRRDFVKAMMAASVSARAMLGQQPSTTPVAPSTLPPTATTAPGPLPWMRGLMEVKPLQVRQISPDAIAETQTQFFSETQMGSLRHLCSVMMPALNGQPGAKEAETPEFLDFLISVSPEDRQQLYRSGLDRLESEARKQFSKSFAEVSDAQAGEILKPWLRTWMSDHPPTEPFADFVNIANGDIRTATINSQAWADATKKAGHNTPDQGLYWYPVDPDLRREGACERKSS
ncbi:gluconate 2-dehydrogenase subunit 3 family protein [Silvibacterium acidisoli]|uniref:gluconate 2-dehydrogenase subunit 3 family protein n=1 Tax=Acidobacteriaceae bacterium ZG23-2 TaxID=2883246 RepID=UPI00406C04F0